MRKILQHRVFFFFLIINTISIGGIGLTSTFITRHWYTNLWYENLNQISDGFTTVVSREFETDGSFIPSSLEGLSEQVFEEYQYGLYIILPDGQVIDQPKNPLPLISGVYELPEVQQALSGTMFTRKYHDEKSGKEYFFMAVPIMRYAIVEGIFLWVIPLQPLYNGLSTIASTIWYITIAAIFLVSIVSYGLLEHSFRPLHSIIDRTIHFRIEGNGFPSASNRRDEYGQLEHALDILAKRLNEQISKLEEKQSMLAAVLENMTDGIIIVAKNGSISLINPAAQSIFKSDDTHTAGYSLAEIVRYHQFVDLWKKSQENSSLQSTTLEISPSNRFIHGIATPLMQDGKAESCLMIFQDLTRVRKLEMVRRDFISNVSHELRTPLTSLKVIVETLNEGALEDPPAAQKFLRHMEDEIDNLTQLVQELLELSKIESGLVPLEKIKVNPQQLAQTAVDRMNMLASRAGITIEMKILERLPEIFADPGRITQVLLNLIHNAIKFTPPGGSISVSAFTEKSQVVFSIKDTGVGIESEALSRIFERFYKADRSRSGGGTGLGLSISRHMVELHGGKIWAESQPGKGSTFYFSLPLDQK